MTTDVKERLAKMDSAWQEAIPDSGFELPPDGDYQAVVERFDFFEAKAAPNHLFLKTELRITTGDYSGASAQTLHNVEDPGRLGWVKGHLRTLGLGDVEPFSTLEQRLQEVVGVPVEIRIKTSNKMNTDGVPYRNVYVNKRLGEAATKGKDPDGDIPF